MQRSSISIAVVLALAAPLAHADDLKALREEVAQMRRSYEERISSLEAQIERLAKAEAQAEIKAGSAEASAREASVAASQKPASEGAFNPAISLVLAGTYTRLSQDPKTYAIGGFVPSGGEVGPPRRSFGLGESELGIAANIDHTLRGQLTASVLPEGGADVEEAFIQTLGLGQGFTLKAGRFLSGIGYLNGQHAHAWDFADAPLAYKAMLGGQLKNDGVQLNWVAPTELFVELGGEAASGGPFPSTDRNKNGGTVGALYARIGGDVGTSNSWRAGLSVLGASPRDRQYEDTDSAGIGVSNAFSGRSRTWLADFVWKWAPEGNASQHSLIVQGEYFHRRENGSLAFDVNGANLASDYTSSQSGFYGQAVYQFMPRWRVGYRYDRLDSGTSTIGLVNSGDLTAADFPLLAAYRPSRNTLMVDYSASEFSRLRLQFAREQPRPAVTDNQIWLQYVVSLGAHGAHTF
jgi:hypothetical protein